MYINRLTIKNYRNFGADPFVLRLKPFTLILGENNVGKTNLLNAVGLLFSQEIATTQRRMLQLDDFNYRTVNTFRRQVADFSIDDTAIGLPEIVIEAALTDFDSDQESVVGDWFADATLGTALVTFRFAPRDSFDALTWIQRQRASLAAAEAAPQSEPTAKTANAHDPWKNVEFPIGEYRYTIFGGGAAGNECDSRHLRMVRAEILDALRDAREELIGGRDNRLLYRVLRRGADSEYANLKQRLLDLQDAMSVNANLRALKTAVQNVLQRVSLEGTANENAVDFQFSSPDAAELLKKVGMVYGIDPVNVARNGLGRNNLLYLSLVLSQLARTSVPDDEGYACFRFVGLEEPEAHLHPHLQDHLSRNIEAIREEHDKAMQLVLTSHSTHIASKLDLANTVVLFQDGSGERLCSHYVLDGIDEKAHGDAIRFLTLYLDATKSRMLFARRLILVEGIAEQTLIPRLFRIHHQGRRTLESVGATVVNVSGVAFRHFLTVVRNGLHVRCVAITDQDSETQCNERADKLKQDFDTPNLIEVCVTTESTFEKDIIAANRTGKGRDLLIEALRATKPRVGKEMEKTSPALDVDLFFAKIEDKKSEFAFNLAALIEPADCGLIVPPYLVSAFDFLR